MSQYFMVEALTNHIVKSPLDNPSTVGNIMEYLSCSWFGIDVAPEPLL